LLAPRHALAEAIVRVALEIPRRVEERVEPFENDGPSVSALTEPAS
jgi:hypothetical protein